MMNQILFSRIVRALRVCARTESDGKGLVLCHVGLVLVAAVVAYAAAACNDCLTQKKGGAA